MLRHRLFGLAIAGLLLLTNVPRASATDGHFLHGVGAINSAMGGAGISAPESLLGTFNLNPAGLMAFDGLRMEFSMEMFQADRTVSSSVPTPTGGTLSGSTQSKKSLRPHPWLRRFIQAARRQGSARPRRDWRRRLWCGLSR